MVIFMIMLLIAKQNMDQQQDWKQVVFKKQTKSKDSRQPMVAATASTMSSKPAWKIEQMVDSDESKKPLDRVSKADAQRIVLGRCAMKLKQQDLATRLNMPIKELQEIEACKAVENKAVLSRIKRFLNVL